MLDSVIAARNRWLAPDGISMSFSYSKMAHISLVVPSRMEVLIAAIQDEEYVNDRVHFWNNVYGFDMTCMKQFLFKDGQVDYADPKSLISEPVSVKTIDTRSTTVPGLDFKSDFELVIQKTGRMHGLVGWFDTYFEGPGFESVMFSTSPLTKSTHWKQTMFMFENPLDVEQGNLLL